jgi:hypothetical protein
MPTAVPVHTTAALANPHTEVLSGHGENVMRVNLTVRASHHRYWRSAGSGGPPSIQLDDG